MEVFGTLEWAVKNYNLVSGCMHDCKYCYSKEMAIRFKRKTPENWSQETELKSIPKRIGKVKGRVMYPSSHDITPDNIVVSIDLIDKILNAGNDILIVSKPHFNCIKSICDKFINYKKQILFRFTIGSSNNQTLKFWEPNAPTFEQRLESLKYAFDNGFNTSLSCEPMLDNNIEDVIDKTSPYITDSIWVGKANFLLRRLKMNGCLNNGTKQKANKLIATQTDKEITSLYNKLKNNKKIKWKESIKKVVNIELPKTKGLDI